MPFLSTLSLRRATLRTYQQGEGQAFLSTLSLRRATPGEHHANSQQEFLSTLSLRRATKQLAAGQIIGIISIHALLAESDPSSHSFTARAGEFLSTLSLRRATQCRGPAWRRVVISIHALLAESDGGRCCCKTKRGISIHALLAESDITGMVTPRPGSDFYPRSPCGERPRWKLPFTPWRIFLSTLSLRRATLELIEAGLYKAISIHALLAESDFRQQWQLHQ